MIFGKGLSLMNEAFENRRSGQETEIEIYVNHNSGYDRDLNGLLISSLMNEARANGWYDSSLWITGGDTATEIERIYRSQSNIFDSQNNELIRTPLILYERPLLVISDNVIREGISRLYLINYGKGEILGCVLGDLQ